MPGQPLMFKLEDSTIVGHHGANLVFKPRGDYWKELMSYVELIGGVLMRFEYEIPRQQPRLCIA